MDNPKLSILILTIPDRAKKLKRLMDVLRPQIPEDGSVEVIVKEELHCDQGGPTVGANRNAALADASGDYVCFINDDDLVPEYYIDRILKAIEPSKSCPEYASCYVISTKVGYRNVTLDDLNSWEFSPDVVGLKGHYFVGVTDILGPRSDTGETFGIVAKNKPELFIHSMKFMEWKTVDGIRQRCPNHINPVKREIALQVPYPDKNLDADKEYSMALLPLLKTEVMIDDCIMYFYLK